MLLLVLSLGQREEEEEEGKCIRKREKMTDSAWALTCKFSSQPAVARSEPIGCNPVLLLPPGGRMGPEESCSAGREGRQDARRGGR